MKTKYSLIFTASIIALIFFGLSQAKPNPVEKSFSVTPGGKLYLDSDSGSVTLESHDRNTVEVVVDKKGKSVEEFEVTFSQVDNHVKVSGKQNKKGFGFGGFSSGVRFTIKVPQQFNVDLRTGGGSIEISDLNGLVEAYTSGGSIELGKIEGDVDVKTSGGSIRVDDVAGNINAHTSGGSVKVRLSVQPTEDSRLTTSGGSITAYLPPSIAVDLNASTSGGRVRSDFSVDGSNKKTRINGSINGGGPELYLKTSGGSVNIKEL